jgi:hypothetical protein
MPLSRKDAEHVFNSLREGTVPERGLEAYAVGIEPQRNELHRLLRDAKGGEGRAKFLRGGYGCGKTFMAQLALQDAQTARLSDGGAFNFATSFVVVSDNDLHFHKFDELYRKVVSSLGTRSCRRGALGDIIDRWIGRIEDLLVATGVAEDDPAFDDKVRAKLDEQLGAMTGGQAPEDMVRVLRAVFDLKDKGDLDGAGALLAWLSGSSNVAAKYKAIAGVKGDLSSSDAMAYLRGIVEITKAAGYDGLVIAIDEAETILRMRSDVRGKSLNGIRQIMDCAKDYPGLLWVFTGTPDFFDIRRGVAGLEPLHNRIQFRRIGDVASLRQPQLELRPFNKERLHQVAMKLRDLFPGLPQEELLNRVSDDFIRQLVEKQTEGYKGDMGVVPRMFLRSFVDILDICAEHPDFDPMVSYGFKPLPLNEVEARRLQGEAEYEPEPEDEQGYSVMEF